MKYLTRFQSHNEYERADAEPSVSFCYNEDEVHYNVADFSQDYLTFVALEAGTFSFSINNLQYSVDKGQTWNTLTAGQQTPTIEKDNTIMWKQIGLTPDTTDGIGTFSSTGRFIARGNIMSLYYGDNFADQLDLTGKPSAFRRLFQSCRKLISAKGLSLPATTLSDSCYRNFFNDTGHAMGLLYGPDILPATTLATYCYHTFFQGCANLIAAPVLPATNLAEYCYAYMFSYCSGLKYPPKLTTTTLVPYCYWRMFQACTSLLQAPKLLSTTLATACYNTMFLGCISLAQAQETLPATTLADQCYEGMFENCDLAVAPSLPATVLTERCYYSMFLGNTRLTAAPILPATTLTTQCYQGMFKNCTSLTNITCLATNLSATDALTNWTENISATGTFTKDTNTTWPSGTSGIPEGWTIQNNT